jgi:hypothetical protein
MRKLAHSLNRPVFVAIPAFFGDAKSRRCVITDIESAGVWLRGEAVNERLAVLTETAPPADTLADVFFPFDQIVYVFDPAQFAFVARNLGMHRVPAKSDEPNPRAPKVPRPDDRSKHKTSKRTR